MKTCILTGIVLVTIGLLASCSSVGTQKHTRPANGTIDVNPPENQTSTYNPPSGPNQTEHAAKMISTVTSGF